MNESCHSQFVFNCLILFSQFAIQIVSIANSENKLWVWIRENALWVWIRKILVFILEIHGYSFEYEYSIVTYFNCGCDYVTTYFECEYSSEYSVCCSELQCVACVVVCCSELQCLGVSWRCVAVCCSVLQWFAVCWRVFMKFCAHYPEGAHDENSWFWVWVLFWVSILNSQLPRADRAPAVCCKNKFSKPTSGEKINCKKEFSKGELMCQSGEITVWCAHSGTWADPWEFLHKCAMNARMRT